MKRFQYKASPSLSSPLEISADGKLLISLSGQFGMGQELRVVEIATGKEIFHKDFDFRAFDLAVSADGKYLAINTAGPNASQVLFSKWQEGEPKPLETKFKGTSSMHLAFAPDGKLLAGVRPVGPLYVWEIPSGLCSIKRIAPETDSGFEGVRPFHPTAKSWPLRSPKAFAQSGKNPDRGAGDRQDLGDFGHPNIGDNDSFFSRFANASRGNRIQVAALGLKNPARHRRKI